MIPERYKDAKWEDVPPAIQQAVENSLKTGKGIYLHGAVGTGKTHIAYAIKKHLEEQGGWLWFWNVNELLREIKLDFNREGVDKRCPEAQLLGPTAMGTKYLAVFEDIGAEKPTEFVAETLYLIVNSRYNNVMPTIFTSNLTLGDLSDRVGERTASRIAEMCEIINLTGGDRRLK